MRHHDGPVDACIVGSGAAGAVLAKELAEAGMTVVVLEAGRWLDTQRAGRAHPAGVGSSPIGVAVGRPLPHGELPWSAKDDVLAVFDKVGYRVEMTQRRNFGRGRARRVEGS